MNEESRKNKMRAEFKSRLWNAIGSCHVEHGDDLCGTDVLGIMEAVKYEFLEGLEHEESLYGTLYLTNTGEDK